MHIVGDPALFSADEILCQTARITVAIARSKVRIAQALALRTRIFRAEFAPPAGSGAQVSGGQGLNSLHISKSPQESDSPQGSGSPRGSDSPQASDIKAPGGALRPSVPVRDEDLFDPWCAHLVAIDTSSDQVVGTYRILTPEAARQLGCRYAEQEFWLTRLDPIRDEIVELGRACVDPAFRGGATLMLMWSGLARWLVDQPYTHLMGCVSVSLGDGGVLARTLYRQLMPAHDAGECFRVWPIHRLRSGPEQIGRQVHDAHERPVALPPLLRAYLRAGARIMGEPCVDQDMHCVDFPVILPLEQLDERFRQRFTVLAA